MKLNGFFEGFFPPLLLLLLLLLKYNNERGSSFFIFPPTSKEEKELVEVDDNDKELKESGEVVRMVTPPPIPARSKFLVSSFDRPEIIGDLVTVDGGGVDGDSILLLDSLEFFAGVMMKTLVFLDNSFCEFFFDPKDRD